MLENVAMLPAVKTMLVLQMVTLTAAILIAEKLYFLDDIFLRQFSLRKNYIL